MWARIALATALGLGACTTYEGLPSDDAASVTVPPEKRAPFNLMEQVAVAGSACAASERQGPQALNFLLGKGYVLVKDLDGTFYSRLEPLTGKRINSLRVGDPNMRLACRIQVTPRDTGQQALAAVVSQLEREGYKLVSERGGMLRLSDGKTRLGVSGSYRHTSIFAEIEVHRLNASNDGQCSDTSLPVSAKLGC